MTTCWVSKCVKLTSNLSLGNITSEDGDEVPEGQKFSSNFNSQVDFCGFVGPLVYR